MAPPTVYGASPLSLALATSGGRYMAAPHLELINQALVDHVLGVRRERVLLLEAPPRHGKSELVSHYLPAWFVGSYPARQVMLASYAADFAKTWGRKARDTLSRHGPSIFNVGVSPSRRATGEWLNSTGMGGMKSAGLGGDFTGRGADLFIVDDPLKNAEQAISDKTRENQWEWFRSTAFTRTEPGALVVVMLTRWNADDMGGRLIKWSDTPEGRKFGLRRISLPAYAGDNDPLGRRPGEPLWPERIGRDTLELRRSMLGAYWWKALYQQQPGAYGKNEWPDEYFDREIWTTPDDWPDDFDAAVVALDPSKGRKTKKGDFSALVFLGLAGGLLWVDASIERRPVPVMCSDAVSFVATNRCDRFGVEANAFQDLLVGPLDDAAEEAGLPPLPIDLIDNRTNKELRISRLGPMLGRRKLRFLRNKGTQRLVEQLQQFPFGDHDDGPDALEMGLRLLRSALREGPIDQAMTPGDDYLSP